MMTLQTFQQHLDQWGTRIDDWPRAEQQAARALLAADAQARSAHAAAEQLTLALQRSLDMPANEALKLRLKRIPAHYRQPDRRPATPEPRRSPGWWWGGGVAVASGGVMALGFMAGFSGLVTLDGSLIDWAALAYGSL
jgi:hypothetical protein